MIKLENVFNKWIDLYVDSLVTVTVTMCSKDPALYIQCQTLSIGNEGSLIEDCSNLQVAAVFYKALPSRMVSGLYLVVALRCVLAFCVLPLLL